MTNPAIEYRPDVMQGEEIVFFTPDQASTR